MVGGPNAKAEDGIAPKGLGPLSYLDDERSYATNEYAIDYNASVIGLIGMLMAEANWIPHFQKGHGMSTIGPKPKYYARRAFTKDGWVLGYPP